MSWTLLTTAQVNAEVGEKSEAQRKRDRDKGLFPPAIKDGNRIRVRSDHLSIHKEMLYEASVNPKIGRLLKTALKQAKKDGIIAFTREWWEAFKAGAEAAPEPAPTPVRNNLPRKKPSR